MVCLWGRRRYLLLSLILVVILISSYAVYGEQSSQRTWKFMKSVLIAPPSVEGSISFSGTLEANQSITITVKLWTTNNQTIQVVNSLYLYYYNETTGKWIQTYYKGLGLATLTPESTTYKIQWTPQYSGKYRVVIDVQEHS